MSFQTIKRILIVLICFFSYSLLQSYLVGEVSLVFAQDTFNGKARKLKSEGDELSKAGKYREAIEKYEEAIGIEPDYWNAHNNMGNAFLELGENYEAIKKYEDTIRLKPDSFIPYNNMGNAYTALKKYENALVSYETAARIKPDLSAIRNNMGNCYIELKRFEEAVGSLKEALRLDKNNYDAMYNLGISYYALERYSDAITAYKKAIKLNPNDGDAYLNMGDSYDRVEEGVLAIKYTKKAKKIFASKSQMKKVSKAGKNLRRFYNKYGDNTNPKRVQKPDEREKVQGEEQEQSKGSKGTGFLLGQSKYVITNNHVVEGANSLFVNFFTGEKVRAKIVAQDQRNDVGILKLARRPRTAMGNIVLGDSNKVEMGQKVFTVGYPMSQLLGKKPKYSEGTINSTTGYFDDPGLFQITVPIQPGNSGGPLFNNDGEVIGITTSSFTNIKAVELTGTIPQNVNFAVKSLYVRALLQIVPDFDVLKLGVKPVPVSPKNDLSGFIKRVKNNIVLIDASIDNSLPEFVEEENEKPTVTVDRSETDLEEKIRLAKARQDEINDRFKTLEEMEKIEESIFPVDEKIKAVQKFLEDYPDRNPKLEEAQNMLKRLMKNNAAKKRFIPFSVPQLN